MSTREDLTRKILVEKRSRGLTWKEIAVAIGPGSPILYTAALLGQMTLTKDEAENAAKRQSSVAPGLHVTTEVAAL
jgi:cyanate lyase